MSTNTTTYASPYIQPQVQPLFATLAITAFISTLLLILMGSIVRVTGYGLGCPDWPTCHGQLIPPAIIDAWVEFSHRFLGFLVSVQIVALGFIASWKYRSERWVFWPAVIIIPLLMLQVTLGGLHVIFELPKETGWIHTAVAMAILGTLAMLIAVTQPAAQELSNRMSSVWQGTKLQTLVAVVAGATYLLILTGSYVTRTGASLICPSFPNCGIEATSPIRGLIETQMLHRFVAFAVAFGIILTVWKLLDTGGEDKGVRNVSIVLISLIAIQFALGISNVLLRLPMWSRALHLLVAGSIWSAMVMLWVVVRRGTAAQ